jgi:hypothetical protein
MPVVTVHGAARRIVLAHVHGESHSGEVRAGTIEGAIIAALKEPATRTMSIRG